VRLRDLDPHWLGEADHVPEPDGSVRPGRKRLGVSFRCPVHPQDGHRLAVLFANPIDGGTPLQGERCHWQRTGDTFDDLTLTPSIDVKNEYIDADGRRVDAQGNPTDVVSSHWHGFITRGEVTGV
jgi:hypothetical protein